MAASIVRLGLDRDLPAEHKRVAFCEVPPIVNSLLKDFRAKLAVQGPRLLAITQRAFLATAIVAIAIYLARHGEELRGLLTWRIVGRCCAVAALMAAVHPVIAFSFFQLQRYAGVCIDLRTSVAIYMRRIPARFLPGGIWHSVSRLADMRFNAGISGVQVRRLFMFEVVLVATSGLLACSVGVAVLAAGSEAHLVAAIQAGVGALIAPCAYALAARRGPWRPLTAALLLYLAIWVLAAIGFSIVAGPVVSAAKACDAAAVASVYIIASVQGYVAIFAPQGWGVAESSFAFLNPCGTTLAGVLGAFLLFRLSIMMGDLLAYAAWSSASHRLDATRSPSVTDSADGAMKVAIGTKAEDDQGQPISPLK